MYAIFKSINLVKAIKTEVQKAITANWYMKYTLPEYKIIEIVSSRNSSRSEF